jgi:hypothetical protein
MRMRRQVFGGLVAGALGGFLVALLRPRRRMDGSEPPATAEPPERTIDVRERREPIGNSVEESGGTGPDAPSDARPDVSTATTEPAIGEARA